MDVTLNVSRPWTRSLRSHLALRRPRARRGRPSTRNGDEQTPVQRVVTLTARAGAPAEELGDRVAHCLGLTLVDRVIPEHVARMLNVPVGDALAMDGTMPSRLESALAWSSPAIAPDLDGMLAALQAVHSFHLATQAVIRDAVSAPSGALVVGRGAAFLLADHPRALHVLVDAPVAWRAAVIGEHAVHAADRAQARYARRAYGVDVIDSVHYGLVVDASTDDVDTMASVVVAEAWRRGLWPPQIAPSRMAG
jgi:hypothetical protein